MRAARPRWRCGSVVAALPDLPDDFDEQVKDPPAAADYAAPGGRLAYLITTRCVTLLRGAWIAARGDDATGKAGQGWGSNPGLPRRQEVRREAAWEPEEAIRRWHSGREDFFLAVSYCWATADDPDPSCWNLERLASALRLFMGLRGVDDCAVFVDYPGLCQRPRKGWQEPLDEHKRMFLAGRAHAHLIYGHACVSVLRMTAAPPGVGWVGGARPFAQRGWPFFEARVCDLKARGPKGPTVYAFGADFDPRRPPDPGRGGPGTRGAPAAGAATRRAAAPPARPATMQGALHASPGRQVRALFRQHADTRHPPLSPADFNAQLGLEKRHPGARQFGEEEDRELVMQLFAEAFVALCGASQDYQGLGWGEPQAAQLAISLQAMKGIRTLNLGWNPLGDRGVEAIATALPGVKSLTELRLHDTKMGAAGVTALCAALSGHRNLARLVVDDNGLNDCPAGEQLRYAWAAAGKGEKGLVIYY